MSFKFLENGLAPRVYDEEDIEDIVDSFTKAVQGSQVILAMTYVKDMFDILDQRLSKLEAYENEKASNKPVTEADTTRSTKRPAASKKEEATPEPQKIAESNE